MCKTRNTKPTAMYWCRAMPPPEGSTNPTSCTSGGGSQRTTEFQGQGAAAGREPGTGSCSCAPGRDLLQDVRRAHTLLLKS